MNATKKTKTPCKAGQPHAWVLAPRKQGTTLVDCPHCARTNLSSTSASNLGACDSFGLYDHREYGLVPPHTEVPLDATKIPAAEFGEVPLDATKIPAAEFGDDPDSWEVDYDHE